MKRGHVLLIWLCFTFSTSALIFSLLTGVTTLGALKAATDPHIKTPEELQIERDLVQVLKDNTDVMKSLREWPKIHK